VVRSLVLPVRAELVSLNALIAMVRVSQWVKRVRQTIAIVVMVMEFWLRKTVPNVLESVAYSVRFVKERG